MTHNLRITDGLHILETAMQVNHTRSAIVAKNLNNQKVDGYVKEEVFSSCSDLSGNQLSKIKQIVNDTQIGILRSLNTKAHEDEIYNIFYEKINTFLGSSQGTFAHSGSQMIDALQSISITDGGVKQDIVSKIQNHLEDIHRFSSFVQKLRTETDQEIGLAVEDINVILKDIYAIRKDIRSSEENFTLIDQRRHQLSLLSEHIGFNVFEEHNPHLFTLSSTKNILLQQHDAYAQFAYTPTLGATPVTQFTPISLTLLDYRNDDVSSQLIGDKGKIKALVDLRDKILPGIYDQLQQYSSNLSFVLNEIHNQGSSFNRSIINGLETTADGNLLTGDTVLNGSGSVFLAQINSEGILQQNSIINFTSNMTVDSLVTSINNSNVATANITNGFLQISSKNSSYGLAIGGLNDTFMSNNKTYGFSHFFGLNNLVTVNPSNPADMKIRNDMQSNSSLLSTGKLVNLTSYNGINPMLGIQDNSILEEIANTLKEKKFIFESTYGNPTLNMTLKDYSASVIDLQRSRKQIAEKHAEISKKEYESLSEESFKMSGIRPDEEHFKAYEISANQMALYRALMIFQKMNDELFEIVR